jgi:hypothetical protein
MAQETAVHRWDGESGRPDRPPPIDAALAVDVIDEYLSHVRPHVVATNAGPFAHGLYTPACH